MKTQTVLSRIFLMLVSSTSVAVFAQNQVIKVGSSCLNLHASPSMHSWTKDCLSTGTVVKILGTRNMNGARYVKVSVDGQTGYLWNTYLHAATATAPTPAAASAATLANRTTYLPGVPSVVPPLAASPTAPGLVQSAAYTPSAPLAAQPAITNPYLQAQPTQPTQSPLASALPLLGAAMNMMGGNSSNNNSNNSNSTPSRSLADTSSSSHDYLGGVSPSEQQPENAPPTEVNSKENVAMANPGPGAVRSEMAGSGKSEPEFTAPSDDKAVAKSNACRGATATRLALAVLYQGCQAAEVSRRGFSTDVCDNDTKSGAIRASFGRGKSSGGSCGMGRGMPQYSQAGARVSVGRNTVSYPGGRTDCSGFVCGTLARAGQNIFPGKPCRNTNTADMMSWAHSRCFEIVRNGKLQEGDIIVGRSGGHGHTGRICGQKGEEDGTPEPTGNPSNLQICHAASGSMGILMQPLDQIMGFTPIGGAIRAPGRIGYVLRHVGNKVPGCMSKEPMTFQGETCVKSCPNINSQIHSAAI